MDVRVVILIFAISILCIKEGICQLIKVIYKNYSESKMLVCMYFLVGAIMFIPTSAYLIGIAKQQDISSLTDSQLYEYISELNETELDELYDSLTEDQQKRVFHVYMMKELETEIAEDAFE